MKKIVSFAVALVLALSMTSCASMLKSMGGVSKAELTAYTVATDEKLNAITGAVTSVETAMKELEEVRALIAKLTADMEEMKLTAQELREATGTIEALAVKVETVSATVGAVSSKVETLSDDTLLKLAQLIQDALKAAEAK